MAAPRRTGRARQPRSDSARAALQAMENVAKDLLQPPSYVELSPEAMAYWENVDSTHCKNLFFRNHKGNRHYMASFECHKNLDIHSLERIVKQGKLSFASPERMERCIGVSPGSVCAFGLIHDMNLVEHPAVKTPDGSRNFGWVKEDVNPRELFDNGHRVKYFLDSELREVPRISFHPCENTASVVIDNAGFMRFLELWGGEVEWIDV